MAFTTIINGATANQAAEVTSGLELVASTAGVVNKVRGDGEVTAAGTDKTVDIAAGEFLVSNANYAAGNGNQKYFYMRSSASEAVTIADNASGNPRIDLICAKIDTGATPGTRGAGSASFVAVQGTPAATPVPPAIPNNHEVLAHVDVANGFSTISNADITDMRRKVGFLDDGWQFVGETWTYAAADDPVFTVTVTGDRSDFYYAGQRVKIYQETGGWKYFLIHLVTVSTNTTLTLFGGTDYNLENETIFLPAISTHKAPAGFPLQPSKWQQTLKVSTFDVRTSSISVGTWYNVASRSISIPVGLWDVRMQLALYVNGTGTDIDVLSTLSTANNSESDSEFTSLLRARVDGNGATPLVFNAQCSRAKVLSLTTKTTYFVNFKTDRANTSQIGHQGDKSPLVVTAISTYL